MTEYTSAHLVVFSPTGTSDRVARAIAKGMGVGQVRTTDLTCDESKDLLYIKDTVAIIAVPVYGGRVAPVAMQRLLRIKAANVPAILVTVYGNRDYDDALLELYDTAIKLGFSPLSAGAFIGEHSYSTKKYPVAAGRPDSNDLQLAFQFGVDSMNKLHRVSSQDIGHFYIKGNRPYKPLKSSAPVSPVSNDNCSGCATCIDVCPTHAIYMNDEGGIETVAEKCIRCCACVKVCPEEARIFDTPFSAFLFQNCSARREPEIFI